MAQNVDYLVLKVDLAGTPFFLSGKTQIVVAMQFILNPVFTIILIRNLTELGLHLTENRMSRLATLTIAIAFVVCSNDFASGSIVVDFLDFSTPGQGSTHNSGGDGFELSPISGGSAPNDWTLTFGSLNTDTTTNEFITVGGLMRVQDWGGTGTITASAWTATSDGAIDIDGVAVAIASGDAFNAGVEGLTWFYSINGAPQVTSGLLGNGTAVNGTDLSHSFSGINVNAGDIVSYGFSVNVDGANDGAEISSQEISFSAIPEPTTIAMFGVAMLGLGFRRRK